MPSKQRRLARRLALLLIVSCLSSHGLAATRGLTPLECAAVAGCVCYDPPGLQKLANALTYGEDCRVEVDALRGYAESGVARAGKEELWQKPEIIVGGMVVSISLGAMIGWGLWHKK